MSFKIFRLILFLISQAVCVGPAPSSQSYLNVPRILEAIDSTGAQAVHPGYGFLSENADFSRTLEQKGVKFIGPRAHSIEAMGDKIESKQLAISAGVNTIPGFMGIVNEPEEVVRISRDIGYPVMIKASAGGGGKGMRIAWNDEEAVMGFRLSKEEAKSSFGDDRIFVEKFIEDPRHIEIQLIADSHGNVVALPERECSIQRRNQKVIEESPSILLDEATRRAMQDQACALAHAVQYESAGTVEFLVDKHKNFYFLEMNTRLQVEHPVTEMVTGLDLVELMIRVAAGEKLPSSLVGSPVPINGWSFESRVYAEDPFRGFLPSTGRLSRYVEPQLFAREDPYLHGGIRSDAGVQQGSEISMYYDPMICKLVTHAGTRDEALDKMRAALDAYIIHGVGHNVPFLRDLTDHGRFISGTITTQFIAEEYPEGFQGVKLKPNDKVRVAAGTAVMNAVKQMSLADVTGRLERSGYPSVSHVIVSIGKQKETFDVLLQIEANEDASEVPTANFVAQVQPLDSNDKPVGEPVVIRLGNTSWLPDAPILFADMSDDEAKESVSNGNMSGSTLRLQHLARLADGFKVQYKGAIEEVRVRSPKAHSLSKHMLAKPERDTSKYLVSPMPGVLVSVAVTEGQEVEAGQELAVVEAMKMQNVLRSPKKGIVKSVPKAAGSTLAVDEIIVEFE